jgi:predicted TPR repeat methyltransferase
VTLAVEFPDVVGLAQDEEWFAANVAGVRRKIRFHDYADIFSVPGLYEALFYGRLKCTSPVTLAGLLGEALAKARIAPSSLRCLDLGAGNGMVGEELVKLGVASVTGVDILPEAAMATTRDRPGLYADYVVADLTALGEADRARLTATTPNLLSTVAALGFGDIPSLAFTTAWNLVTTPAWVVFNIKQDFLDQKYQHGFSLLVRRLREKGLFQLHAEVAYTHRLALDGTPLPYIGMVGVKTGVVWT